MLQYLKQSCSSLPDHARRDQIKAAVLEGALLRIRPVMMTAIATIVGLIPVMYGVGTGSEVMSRIAAPMVGGMVSSVVLTLIILPVAYYLWQRVLKKN
jgi:Cu(I)/Ag(I) efflux system membrane protein CusA/SilA